MAFQRRRPRLIQEHTMKKKSTNRLMSFLQARKDQSKARKAKRRELRAALKALVSPKPA
jgi:hypothetical protein